MDVPRLLAALRAATVAAGVVGHVSVAAFVAGLELPPPGGDAGLVGLGFAFALVAAAAAGVVTAVGYGLPAGGGRLRVGPLADRPCRVRLLAGGAASSAAGLALTLVFASLLSGASVVVVWVLGVGLLAGGLVALALAGVAVAIRVALDALDDRRGTGA